MYHFLKKDFIKFFQQLGAELNNENHNIKFYFVEKVNFIQKVNAYIELAIEIRKADNTSVTNADEIRLNNNELVSVFKKVDYVHPHNGNRKQ